MSNQVFKDETQVFPVINTANALQQGGIGGPGRYVQIDSTYSVVGRPLVVQDLNSGTYADPDIASFSPVTFNEFTSTGAIPAGATTTVAELTFNNLPSGFYEVDLWLRYEYSNLTGQPPNANVLTIDYDNGAGYVNQFTDLHVQNDFDAQTAHTDTWRWNIIAVAGTPVKVRIQFNSGALSALNATNTLCNILRI